jgi:hypothetical protein
MIDFSSNSLPEIRDGNTISNGKWLRRGLPLLKDDIKIPKSRHIELISYTKTNGDCCMFSYIDSQDSFLIASRSGSVLVKDLETLEDI